MPPPLANVPVAAQAAAVSFAHLSPAGAEAEEALSRTYQHVPLELFTAPKNTFGAETATETTFGPELAVAASTESIAGSAASSAVSVAAA